MEDLGNNRHLHTLHVVKTTWWGLEGGLLRMILKQNKESLDWGFSTINSPVVGGAPGYGLLRWPISFHEIIYYFAKARYYFAKAKYYFAKAR